MWKWTLGCLAVLGCLFISLLIAIGYFIHGFADGEEVREIARVPNAGLRLDAVHYVCGGGGAAGYVYDFVAITPRGGDGRRASRDGKAVFVGDGNAGDTLEMRWQGDRLDLAYSAGIRVSKQATEATVAGKKVQIEFHETDPGGEPHLWRRQRSENAIGVACVVFETPPSRRFAAWLRAVSDERRG